MGKLKVIISVLLSAVAVNALLAGFSFIKDPGGQGLKVSVEFLRYSPFHDFLVPGVILFCVNGVLNVIAAITLICNWKYSWLFVAFQGMMLNGWIVIQVFMLRDFNILHVAFLILGIFFSSVGLFLHKPHSLNTYQ
jgi:hypothetical protein